MGDTVIETFAMRIEQQDDVLAELLDLLDLAGELSSEDLLQGLYIARETKVSRAVRDELWEQ